MNVTNSAHGVRRARRAHQRPLSASLSRPRPDVWVRLALKWPELVRRRKRAAQRPRHPFSQRSGVRRHWAGFEDPLLVPWPTALRLVESSHLWGGITVDVGPPIRRRSADTTHCRGGSHRPGQSPTSPAPGPASCFAAFCFCFGGTSPATSDASACLAGWTDSPPVAAASIRALAGSRDASSW